MLNTADALIVAKAWMDRAEQPHFIASQLIKAGYSAKITESVLRELGMLVARYEENGSETILVSMSRVYSLLASRALGFPSVTTILFFTALPSCDTCKGSGCETWDGAVTVDKSCPYCSGLGTEPKKTDQVDTAE